MVTLYIAQSLDGKIADKCGNIKFLDEIDVQQQGFLFNISYSSFINDIDCVLLGRTTYEQVLSFDVDYPYQNIDNYVVTTNDINKQYAKAITINEVNDLVGNYNNVFLVGGSKLISYMLNENLVDKIILTTVPVIIGQGIDLFDVQKQINLSLISSFTTQTGILQQEFIVNKN